MFLTVTVQIFLKKPVSKYIWQKQCPNISNKIIVQMFPGYSSSPTSLEHHLEWYSLSRKFFFPIQDFLGGFYPLFDKFAQKFKTSTPSLKIKHRSSCRVMYLPNWCFPRNKFRVCKLEHVCPCVCAYTCMNDLVLVIVCVFVCMRVCTGACMRA